MARTTNVEITNRNTPLRVGLHGRFSTDEQSKTSTPDQMTFGRRVLVNYKAVNPIVEEFPEEGISGQILSRPGLDRLKLWVRQRRLDLILTEDVSRLYRDRSEPHKFAGLCVDHDVRLICVHDRVDTNQPDWEEAILRASERHAGYTDDGAHRIHRAYDARWEQGCAVKAAPPGYINVAVDPGETAKTGRGPFLTQKVERCAETIVELFERVARGDRRSSVADFLNKSKFPVAYNSHSKRHTENTLTIIIRDTLYKGIETGGKTRNEKQYSSGKHREVHNPPENRRQRPMPHLRFVSDLLWQQANDVLDARDAACGKHPRGVANPTYGIPRDSRSLLSNHFYCGVCGGKMIGQGRHTKGQDGTVRRGYRCATALRSEPGPQEPGQPEDRPAPADPLSSAVPGPTGPGRHDCWLRATCFQDLAHQRIIQAVIDQVLSLEGAEDALVELTRRLSREGGELAEKCQTLRSELKTLNAEIDTYGEAVAHHPNVQTFAEKLTVREQRRSVLQGELQALEGQIAAAAKPVSREEVLVTAKDVAGNLAEIDDEAREVLRQLTTQIVAVPYQRIDCPLIVLRARFRINLVALLPAHWQQLLREADVDLEAAGLLSHQIEVDLYDEPKPVQIAREALAAHREGLRITDTLARERFGTSRKTVYEAINLATLMEERGLDQPYVELKERPASASRYGRRTGKNDGAGDVAAG